MSALVAGAAVGGASLVKETFSAIHGHKSSRKAYRRARQEYLLEVERRRKEIANAYVGAEREKYETVTAAAQAKSAQEVEGKREAARLSAAAATAGIVNGGTAQALQAEVDAQTAIGISGIEREKVNRILQSVYAFESVKNSNQPPVFMGQRPKTSDLYTSLLLGAVNAGASGYSTYSSVKAASKKP